MATAEPLRIPWTPGVAIPGLIRKLVWQSRPGLAQDELLPRLVCEARGVTVDREHLASYQRVTQSIEPRQLPLLYPHVLMGGGHLAMVSDPRFPLRVLGLLHLRNHVVRYRAIDPTEVLDLHCEIARQRITEKGLEFDLDTTVSSHGEIVWRSVSTLFKRGKFGPPDSAAPLANLFARIDDAPRVAVLAIPADIGRQYARISGDYNPIHVSRLLAKLFGFKTSIAHGMWSTARVLSSLFSGDLHGVPADDRPLRLDVVFKGPCFTGSTAYLHRQDERFDLFCGSNPKPVIQGRLRYTDLSDRIL